MSLVEHLRELRSRMVKGALAIVVGTVVGWVLYEPVFDVLSAPIDAVIDAAREDGRDVRLVLTGVADPFFVQIKVAAMTGVVISSPVWLYQMWAFVTPGLHRNERRWAMGFLAVAVPLFLAGVAVAYAVMPMGLDLLLGFTPQGVENLVTFDRYLNFVIRMVLVFGIGFELPVFVVMLNLAGVLPWARLKAWTRGLVFAVFVFAAVATPTGDPLTMGLLAAPLLVLLAGAYLVAYLVDRRRRAHDTEPDYAALADDEASPLGPAPAPTRLHPVDEPAGSPHEDGPTH